MDIIKEHIKNKSKEEKVAVTTAIAIMLALTIMISMIQV